MRRGDSGVAAGAGRGMHREDVRGAEPRLREGRLDRRRHRRHELAVDERDRSPAETAAGHAGADGSRRTDGGVLDLAGRTDLAQLAAVLERAAVVVVGFLIPPVYIFIDSL